MYIYGEVNVVVMLLFSRQKNWETCDRKREKKSSVICINYQELNRKKKNEMTEGDFKKKSYGKAAFAMI